MTSDNANESEWAKDLYTASASDWTPAMVSRAVYVLYAPVSRDAEVSRRCALVLSDAELERADRFVTGEGRTHFIQRRAFRRYCGALALGAQRSLSQIVFRETEKGRPYLPDLPDFRFSFSSCRFGFLGAWSATHCKDGPHQLNRATDDTLSFGFEQEGHELLGQIEPVVKQQHQQAVSHRVLEMCGATNLVDIDADVYRVNSSCMMGQDRQANF